MAEGGLRQGGPHARRHLYDSDDWKGVKEPFPSPAISSRLRYSWPSHTSSEQDPSKTLKIIGKTFVFEVPQGTSKYLIKPMEIDDCVFHVQNSSAELGVAFVAPRFAGAPYRRPGSPAGCAGM